MPLSEEAHKKKHEELDKALRELVADYTAHTRHLPHLTTLDLLMQWSKMQVKKPDEFRIPDETHPGTE